MTSSHPAALLTHPYSRGEFDFFSCGPDLFNIFQSPVKFFLSRWHLGFACQVFSACSLTHSRFYLAYRECALPRSFIIYVELLTSIEKARLLRLSCIQHINNEFEAGKQTRRKWSKSLKGCSEIMVDVTSADSEEWERERESRVWVINKARGAAAPFVFLLVQSIRNRPLKARPGGGPARQDRDVVRGDCSKRQRQRGAVIPSSPFVTSFKSVSLKNNSKTWFFEWSLLLFCWYHFDVSRRSEPHHQRSQRGSESTQILRWYFKLLIN